MFTLVDMQVLQTQTTKIANHFFGDITEQEFSSVRNRTKYSYVFNSPVNFTDPSGFECFPAGGYIYFWSSLGMWVAIPWVDVGCSGSPLPNWEPNILEDDGGSGDSGSGTGGGGSEGGENQEARPQQCSDSSTRNPVSDDPSSLELTLVSFHDAYDNGYYGCLGMCMAGEITAPFQLLLGKELLIHALDHSQIPERAAGNYYRYVVGDGRFTALGRYSRVLVPRVAGYLRTGLRAVPAASLGMFSKSTADCSSSCTACL